MGEFPGDFVQGGWSSPVGLLAVAGFLQFSLSVLVGFSLFLEVSGDSVCCGSNSFYNLN